jgi:hypothetical protein
LERVRELPIAVRTIVATLVMTLALSVGPHAQAAQPAPAPAPARPPPQPLTIAVATFATAFASEGRCLARPDPVFEPADQVVICVTLSGFGARPITTGVRPEFQIGVLIRTAGDGRILARSNEFDNLYRDFPVAPAKYEDVVRVNLPSLRPGDYVLQLTIRDLFTGRTGTAELPFSIMPRL